MLKELNLKNYRNLLELHLSLSNKNIIAAPNGSGKTNILEAIFYSTTGESFHPLSSYSDFIAHEQEFARIDTIWDLGTIESVVSNINNKLLRKFSINSKKVAIKEIWGKFPTIVFSPSNVNLIEGEPAIRRMDLDYLLSLLNREYKDALVRYKNIIKNRNALLKARVNDMQLLNFWTEELIKSGNIIFNYRDNFITNFSNDLVELQQEIIPIGKNTIRIKYISKLEDITQDNFQDIYRAKYNENIEKEKIVGKTLYGVHKDDYSLFLDDENMRYLSSRGQQRIGVLMYKLIQANIVVRKLNVKPLMLLDDLMSELDQNNRNKVIKYILKSDYQFILTTADLKEYPQEFLDSFNLIKL